MSPREKLARKAASFLAPGEHVEQVFRARVQVPSTNLVKANLVIVGTADSVLILQTGAWSTIKPKKLVDRVPKGPGITLLDSQRLWSVLRIGPHEVRVTVRFAQPDLDQLLTSSAGRPT